MNAQTTINDSWLRKIRNQELQTYHLMTASLCIVIIAIMAISSSQGTTVDSALFAALGYLLIALLTTSLLLTIFGYSRGFKDYCLKKNYRAEKARLCYFLDLRQAVRESFQDFVDRMIDKAVLHRPGDSAELKQAQVAAMEKWRDEIAELRDGFRKKIGKEDSDTIKAIRILAELDGLDEENIEFLLESLSVLMKEDELWETGGKEAYRKRIAPIYFSSYEHQLKRKLEWPNSTISVIKERLKGMKELAKERGVLLENDL